MSIEHTLVLEILCWLQDRHGSWRRKQRGPALRFLDRVYEKFTAFPETDLKDLLTHKLNFDSEDVNKYLFLEPIDEGTGIVPMLSFRYDFQQNKSELHLQVALFVPDGNDDVAAIGCRFEPSEGPGTHDYFHAQLFHQFRGRGGAYLPSCPHWLPTSRPAFQLKAYDPVTLLISMVISLYGVDRVQDLRQARFANELKRSMESLCPTAEVRKSRPATTEPPSQRAKRIHR